MHAFTSHRDGSRRYFANFDLPTHPLCWLRGHRAKAEVIESRYSAPWILITCRTCGIRHTDPYMHHGKIDPEAAAATIARQVDAARSNAENYARGRDGRDGYGHHRLELSLEVTDNRWRRRGVHLHIGDRWSETPFDGSLSGGSRSAYFSVGGVGNRLAQWLTKGKKRDIAIGAGYKGEGA